MRVSRVSRALFAPVRTLIARMCVLRARGIRVRARYPARIYARFAPAPSRRQGVARTPASRRQLRHLRTHLRTWARGGSGGGPRKYPITVSRCLSGGAPCSNCGSEVIFAVSEQVQKTLYRLFGFRLLIFPGAARGARRAPGGASRSRAGRFGPRKCTGLYTNDYHFHGGCTKIEIHLNTEEET